MAVPMPQVLLSMSSILTFGAIHLLGRQSPVIVILNFMHSLSVLHIVVEILYTIQVNLLRHFRINLNRKVLCMLRNLLLQIPHISRLGIVPHQITHIGFPDIVGGGTSGSCGRGCGPQRFIQKAAHPTLMMPPHCVLYRIDVAGRGILREVVRLLICLLQQSCGSHCQG